MHGWSLLGRCDLTNVKRLQTLSCRTAWSSCVEHIEQQLQGEITSHPALWIRYFPLCVDSDTLWTSDYFKSGYMDYTAACNMTCDSCCCRWWRWRGPVTGCPRSNKSGWMSFRNWGLMWRCVTWWLLEPEELVWNKQTRNNWLTRLCC